MAISDLFKGGEGGKVKAGIYTSELWLTVLTSASSLIATYGGLIPPPWGMIVSAVVTAGYTISRGLAKQGK